MNMHRDRLNGLSGHEVVVSVQTRLLRIESRGLLDGCSNVWWYRLHSVKGVVSFHEDAVDEISDIHGETHIRLKLGD